MSASQKTQKLTKDNKIVVPPETTRPNFIAPFIYGLHESGGEHLMLEARRPGWVVELASIGLNGAGNAQCTPQLSSNNLQSTNN